MSDELKMQLAFYAPGFPLVCASDERDELDVERRRLSQIATPFLDVLGLPDLHELPTAEEIDATHRFGRW